jgi:acyl-CoA thioesterase-1
MIYGMISRCAILSILCLCFTSNGNPVDAASQTGDHAGPAQGVSVQRRNIGLFFDKLRAGKAVTVAYVGGSSAAGLGLSNPEKTSYRALVTDWLRKNFSRSQIREINGGVAHTGSLYATLRARRDVIADKPDLVFVDLAASDAGESEETVKKAVEGLLRQLLVVPQPPEVVMLYSATPALESRIEWYEVIAAHYQIPTLNLQTKLQPAIEAGKFKPGDLWKSNSVAIETGHKAYADIITTFLSEQQAVTPTPLVRTLSSPLISDELNYGEFRALAEIKHDSVWRADAVNDRFFPAELLVANKPGAQLDLYFEGTVIGLSFRGGPDAGMFECLINDKPAPAPLTKIDAYDAGHHISTRITAGGLGPGEHKLTIRVLGEKNPKSSGNNIRLGYLLVGGARPERL